MNCERKKYCFLLANIKNKCGSIESENLNFGYYDKNLEHFTSCFTFSTIGSDTRQKTKTYRRADQFKNIPGTEAVTPYYSSEKDYGSGTAFALTFIGSSVKYFSISNSISNSIRISRIEST